MKYFIQTYKNKPVEVTKEIYQCKVDLAGFWLGDEKLIGSFYDVQHDIRGWVEYGQNEILQVGER